MKKILLIGGTGGIGSELSKNLSSRFECISVGSKLCDVTNENSVKLFLESNDYDIIIYLSVKNIDGLIHKQSSENVNEQLNVNINGFLNILRYSTPYFREKNYGRIIYVSSILSKKPIRGTGIYAASKSFCESVIKTHSLENSKYGITSNSIQLGYFEGGLTDKVPENIIEGVIKTIPLQRLGKCDEISKVIESVIDVEYINGTTISITGGYEN